MNEDGFWGRYKEGSELFFGKGMNGEGGDDNLQRSVRIGRKEGAVPPFWARKGDLYRSRHHSGA